MYVSSSGSVLTKLSLLFAFEGYDSHLNLILSDAEETTKKVWQVLFLFFFFILQFLFEEENSVTPSQKMFLCLIIFFCLFRPSGHERSNYAFFFFLNCC
jgi:hypothetical protein